MIEDIVAKRLTLTMADVPVPVEGFPVPNTGEIIWKRIRALREVAHFQLTGDRDDFGVRTFIDQLDTAAIIAHHAEFVDEAARRLELLHVTFALMAGSNADARSAGPAAAADAYRVCAAIARGDLDVMHGFATNPHDGRNYAAQLKLPPMKPSG